MYRGRSRRGRAAKRTSMRARGRRGPLAQSTWQGRRADRVPRGVLNVYTYDFTLTPQIVAASPLTAGAFLLAAAPSGQVPITSLTGLAGSASPTNSVFTNVSDVTFATIHRLNDIANVTKFQAMYDAYRINTVTVIMEYMNSHSAGGGLPVTPTIYYYQDMDDATNPPALGSILGKQGVQSFTPSGNQTVKAFTFRPRQAISVEDNTGAPTALIPSPRQWTDCITSLVNHYSCKFYISDMYSPGNASGQHAWRFTFKYNVSFRGPLACN